MPNEGLAKSPFFGPGEVSPNPNFHQKKRNFFIFDPVTAEEEKICIISTVYYLNSVPGHQSCDYEHPELPQ